ncbi:MAG: alpha/beta hydrolase family protein, partial [Waddliaceae bacterium]
YYSIPKHISFPSANSRTAHGYYYAPQNKEYCGPEGELPPLIVKTHGGPTANTSNVFDLKIQYWTSRGFAVLDVDYGGSTGYGRQYRELLKGAWGIVDREDVEHGARYLVEKGLVHPKKLAITGGSAGGYTTLNALTFGNVFNVGASYYGVSDLELLTKETHKFESRYLDKLIGPYPEEKELYIERSPIHFSERINTPVIFFQGLEDAIVLPNQAEILFQSLKKKGLLTRLVTYEGEQHGFRQEKTIQDALIKELKFYLEAFE